MLLALCYFSNICLFTYLCVYNNNNNNNHDDDDDDDDDDDVIV